MNPAAIDLRLLRSFINTARLGSVTKAASVMHLTQPALSQHLRELAALTGVPLFDRVGRGLSLTAAGSDLFREIEPLLLQLDFVLTSAKDRSREVRGSLRVGAIDTYARALVIPAVAQLLDHHPELTVVIEELPAPEIDRGLAQGELDIGVAFSHLSSADIEQRTLFEESLMLVYLAGKRRVKPASVTLQQVAQHPLALLNRSFAMRRQIDAAFARADLTLDVRVEAANVDSLIRLTEHGRFATIASSLAVNNHPNLQMQMIAQSDLSRIAALRWRQGRTFSPAIRSFNSALENCIQTTRLANGGPSQLRDGSAKTRAG